jgi:hypothetical protein
MIPLAGMVEKWNAGFGGMISLFNLDNIDGKLIRWRQ